MRINGTWLLCDDGVPRPVFWAEIFGSQSNCIKLPFLADCGADRTVLSAAAFVTLGYAPSVDENAIVGIGGMAESVVVDTRIRISRSDGGVVTFRGQFSAVLGSMALDISLLCRDITNHLALVIDRPGDAVCLLSRGEVYQA